MADQPAEALQVATRLRQVDPDQLTKGLLAFDRSIFVERACELAAIACLQISRKGQSMSVETSLVS